MYDSRRGKAEVFVNNGLECKRIASSDLSKFLADGWVHGRLNRSSTITVGKDGYLKQIDMLYLPLWQKAGWQRVVNPKKTKYLKNSPYKGNIKINKNGIEFAVSFDVLPYFIEDGWSKGRISKSI